MTTKRSGTKAGKVYLPDLDVSEWQAKQWQDPAFARAHEELAPEFEIAEQVIALRLEQKMTQAELARRSGTKQPSIARLEKGKRVNDLGFVKRVAGALNSSVHVSLKPRSASIRKLAGLRSRRSTASVDALAVRRTGTKSKKKVSKRNK